MGVVEGLPNQGFLVSPFLLGSRKIIRICALRNEGLEVRHIIMLATRNEAGRVAIRGREVGEVGGIPEEDAVRRF